MEPSRCGPRLRAVTRVLRALARRRSPVEAEVAALDGVLPAGGVGLDVGAAYGLYTLTFAARVGPAGRVLSFEPLPGPGRWLAWVLRMLGVDNVLLVRRALGDRPGRGRMSLPRRRGLPVHGRAFLSDDAHHLGSNTEFPADVPVPVSVATLDGAVVAAGLERVDLLKIDVEGAELSVLQGAERTIERHRPAVLVEIERRHLTRFALEPADLVAWFDARDYRMSTLEQGSWQPVAEVTTRRRNYLFRPTERG